MAVKSLHGKALKCLTLKGLKEREIQNSHGKIQASLGFLQWEIKV